jgi:hypothetical protein
MYVNEKIRSVETFLGRRMKDVVNAAMIYLMYCINACNVPPAQKEILKKLKVVLTFDSTIPILGIYLMDCKSI